jgi:hypothetical protein
VADKDCIAALRAAVARLHAQVSHLAGTALLRQPNTNLQLSFPVILI